MNHRLACILLVFITTACNARVSGTPHGTEVIPPTNWSSPSPTVQSQTPSITAGSPTDPPKTAVPPTSVPCDPSKNYCIEAGHFLLERPIAMPGTNTIDRGYPYGGTDGGKRETHHGVEFYDASGTPVLAAADGLVLSAGDDSQTRMGPRLNFYGNVIILEHHFAGSPQPIYTLYGHLSKVEALTGQTVRSGDKIGEVGASGEATGSHLHFEVRVGQNNYDSTRNPILWLKPLIGEDGASNGVIAGGLVDAQGKTLQTTNINIQYFLDTTKPEVAAYQVDTYSPGNKGANGDDLWNENFALGDLTAGNYRLSLLWNGVLYERRVPVQPGKLTFVVFKLDR
jgi:murein DD-endopeptidase MepM/ murein hydrolase activator NlpD